MPDDDLMSREQVAEFLARVLGRTIAPNSVRTVLARYGIREQRGYPRAAVEALAQPGGRPGRGARTDLHRTDPNGDPR